MPERFVFDLKQLIQVCLNDPAARAEVVAALEGEPAAVRSPCGTLSEGEQSWSLFLQTDRAKSPGEAGFFQRDTYGKMVGRFRAVATRSPDASTMSPEQLAASMGLTVEELQERLKKGER